MLPRTPKNPKCFVHVAVHGENFDLSKLKKGALIGMLADIKADFSE